MNEKWEIFSKVIDRAKLACKNSDNNIDDHFPEVRKMVEIGSKTKRKNLKEKDKILDFMGSTELIANLFRISQTEEKLKIRLAYSLVLC